jgi:hypothetical protein
MSISISTIRTKVFTRLAAELAVPLYSKINNASITTWADELTALVTQYLLKQGNHGEIQQFKVIGTVITITAGQGNLPAGYEQHLGAKVSVDGNYKNLHKLFDDPVDFARWDSSNFILTPTNRKPVGLIASNKIYIKPTSIVVAYLDYLKIHPTLASNNTLYGEIGDTILVGLIVARCFDFLELHDLANIARNEVIK